MSRKITIDEVRNFLFSASKQFEQGGVFVTRVRFIRNENGAIQDIFIDHEDREETAKKGDDNVQS